MPAAPPRIYRFADYITKYRSFITHIQGRGNYSLVYVDGQKPVVFAKTLTDAIQQADHLHRVHRAYAVNPDWVQEVHYDLSTRTGQLILKNGLIVDVSRRRWTEVLANLRAHGFSSSLVLGDAH